MKPVRVLLADDHTLVRAGLRKLLESLPDIEVVGESGAAPAVTLSGPTAKRATELGIVELRVSLSHVDSLAGACVMAVASSYEGAEHG